MRRLKWIEICLFSCHVYAYKDWTEDRCSAIQELLNRNSYPRVYGVTGRMDSVLWFCVLSSEAERGLEDGISSDYIRKELPSRL